MKIWDVIIIGAGASGLMAAGRAAELGAQVLLLEKNKQAGLKLLMSGGGRCNFTNNSSINIFAQALGLNGRWLLSALNNFGPQDVIHFFKSKGVSIKIENNNRVFPASNKALDILNTLLAYVKQHGVRIKTESTVRKVVVNKNKIESIILADGLKLQAKNYVIATGGASYPVSGSSGDAYAWLKSLGHSLVKPSPALSQLYVKEIPLMLEGLSIETVILKLNKGNKKIASESGPIIFTSKGLSGPAAINLSRYISHMSIKDLQVEIDFFPLVNIDDLDLKIKSLISENPRHYLKNTLTGLIPKRLVEYLLNYINLSSDLKGADLNRLQRLSLVKILKSYSLDIKSLGGFNEAMITSGGVSLKEVDGKTMQSKIISNLYLAGECLDLDGPTGGYNLQIAWSTGFVAGESLAMKLS